MDTSQSEALSGGVFGGKLGDAASPSLRNLESIGPLGSVGISCDIADGSGNEAAGCIGVGGAHTHRCRLLLVYTQTDKNHPDLNTDQR